MYSTVIKQLIENRFIVTESLDEELVVINVLRNAGIEFRKTSEGKQTKLTITEAVANALRLHKETKHIFEETK